MENSGSIVALVFTLILYLCLFGVYGFILFLHWKIMEKAGKPGWVVLIPFYNIIVYCEILGRPAWWILIALCGGPIFAIITAMDLAERFGQERNWGIIWLWLIAPFGWYKLAFNEDMQYTAPTNPA